MAAAIVLYREERTMKKSRSVIALALCCIMFLSLFGCGSEKPADFGEPAAAIESADLSAQLSEAGYTLKKVVVLSRHNIRSPLSGEGSVLGSVTTHQWCDWSSATSELTVLGGVSENIMGQYFRKWAVQNGLFDENEIPAEGEVRFYSNAKQRTLATSKNFSAGMFPVTDIPIETHAEYDTMDPVFTPAITFVSEAYNDAVQAQIDELFRQDEDFLQELQSGYALIEDVIGYKDSSAYNSGEVGDLVPDDFTVELEQGKEPSMQGSLKLGCQISDALVLQYLETPNDADAGFGQTLDAQQWRTISKVKDLYGDVLFTAPLVSVNVANPLIKEIKSDLEGSGKFTFLCGHDSNIGSVLAALGVQKYELPGTPETVPIGAKLAFEIWEKDGQSYAAVHMIYAAAEQLRANAILSPDAPPVSYYPEFDGMSKNADGLYGAADLAGRMQQALDSYDALLSQYSDVAEAA